MAINPANGVLDITNGIIRVSAIDVRDATGFNTAINNVARNTILLYDDQESTTNFIPHSTNDYQSTTGVTRDTTNKYIELNSASDDGWIYWPLKLPNAWKAEFDMNITASGGLFTFTFFNTSTPNHSNDLSNDGGYKIIFDNTNNNIIFRLQGVSKSTTSVNLRSNDWQHVNINYYYGQTSVSIDGKIVASYRFTEDQHETNHRYVGFSAKTGTIHKIRKININNADKWTFTDDSNASDICYLNGNVGIGTTTTDHLLDVHGNAYISENLTIQGDLNVLGTTTMVQIEDLQVENAIIELGNNNVSDTIDLGIVMNRPTANVVVGFRGDESELAIGYTHSDPSGSHIVPIADGALKTTIYGNLHSNNVTTGGLTVDDGFSMGSHILPTSNDTYDIGSAEYKIRDLYVADNSLWVGDEAKITFSSGELKFRKRKTDTVPAAVTAAGGHATGAKAFAGVSNLTDIKAYHWLKYMRTLSGQSNAKMSDVFRDDDADYETTSTSSAWSDVGDHMHTVQSVAIGKTTAPTAPLDVAGAGVFSGNITTTGNIGVNKTSPTADVHVVGYQYINDAPTITNSFDHTTAPLTLTNSTVTSTTAVNDPSPVLHLTREGTSSQSYGARATMDLCRWENNGTNSRSRLDFQLAEGTYANTHVMSLRSDGRVGIGVTSPAYKLDVDGDLNLSTGSTLRINGTPAVFSNWTVSGSDIYRSSGKVGVGTTSPGEMLHVHAASNPQILVEDTGTANRAEIRFKTAATDWTVGQHGGDSGKFKISNDTNVGTTSDVTIDQNGNVGIGTNNPDTKLTVSTGSITTSAEIAKFHSYYDSNNNGYLIIEENNHTSGNNDWTGYGTRIQKKTDSTDQGYIEFNPVGGQYSIAFGNDTTEYMRIEYPDGNVGIGTTDPGTKLNMKGGVFLAENQSSTNNQILYGDGGGAGANNNSYTIANPKFGTGVFVNDTGTTGSTITLVNKEGANNTTKHASIGFVTTDTTYNGKFGGQIGFWPEDANASKMQFRIYTSGAQAGYNLPVQRMVVDGDGNVGVGTTSPDAVLDVQGLKTRFKYEYRYQDLWTSNNNQTFTIPVTGGSARGLMFVEAKVIQVAANSSSERVARVKGMISNYHTGNFYMTVIEGENVSAFETYMVGTSGSATGTFTMKYRPEAGYQQDVVCRLYLKIWHGGYTSTFGALSRTDTGSNTALTAPTWDDAATSFGGNVGIGTTSPAKKLHVYGSIQCHNTGNTGDEKGLFLQSVGDWYNLSPGNDGYLHLLGGASGQGHMSGNYTPMKIGKLITYGAVGIGTTSPHGELHIGPKDSNHIYLASANNSYGWKLDTHDYGSGEVPFRLIRRTGGSDATVLTVRNQDGSVGIGTSTFTDTRNLGGLHIRDNRGISFAASTNSGSRHWRIRPDDYSDHGSLQIGVSDNNTTCPDAQDEAVMTMTRNRYVGIGTTSPTSCLEIRSSTTIPVFRGDAGRAVYQGSGYNIVNSNGFSETHNNYAWDGYPGVVKTNSNGEWRVHGQSSYNVLVRSDVGFAPFTGLHETYLPFDEDDKGMIVYSTGNYASELKDGNVDGVVYDYLTISDACPVVKICTTENDKRVIGVLSNRHNRTQIKEITEEEYELITGDEKYVYAKKEDSNVYVCDSNTDEFSKGYYNAVGEGSIWVCNKNGDLENGDYITSSTVAGYGQKQNDDLLHNYTVAKITTDCDFSEIWVTTKKHKKTKEGYTFNDNNEPVYENILDDEGNTRTHLKFKIRYLLPDATQISKSDYDTKLAAGEEVYKAAFVGCTYHCG